MGAAIQFSGVEAFDIPFQFSGMEARLEELDIDALRHVLRVRSGEALVVSVVGQLHRLPVVDDAGGRNQHAGTVVEATVSASGVEARTMLGAAEGVMDDLVALVEEKANARAVRVRIRALFALCLAKENRLRVMAAGAVSALAGRVAEGDTRELERALVAMEHLCRAKGGHDAMVTGAGGGARGGATAVVALVRTIAGSKAVLGWHSSRGLAGEIFAGSHGRATAQAAAALRPA
ncbi:U-box domain-containing protein 26-like [Miscanthus floridulus]|uniref:U-box domain-containing protein 26-like n=1 Tax=Miscanthus floridulus TaxID=154761 RepID=UPI00345A1DBD